MAKKEYVLIPDDVIPVRKDEWVEKGGLIIILHKKWRGNKWYHKLLKKIFPDTIRIRLDDIGSEVWRLMDGKRNVGEIAEALESKFGERVKPVRARLTVFFMKMFKGDMVEFRRSP